MTRSGRIPARIAVDLLGGDEAPAVVVDGALHACHADPDLHLHLVGPIDLAEQVKAGLPPAERARITVQPVNAVAAMHESAMRGVRVDTSVRAAVAAVARGRADAIVSAGATGATVTASVVGLGRARGVRRPALAVALPARRAPVILLDVGATVDVGSAALIQHAFMGAGFAQVAHGITSPRVGLLSIGSEPGKGDRLRRVVDAALRTVRLPGDACYAGLAEGDDVATGGRADVVVTDGFTGNILLKGIEGGYAMAGGATGRDTAPRAAILLGVAGIVVVCHGAAAAVDIASGIELAARMHRIDLVRRLSAVGHTLAEVTA